MERTSHWGANLFGALLPLFVGGLALLLMQDGGYWKTLVSWLSEGSLMLPAAILCFGVHQVLGSWPDNRANRWASNSVMAFGILSVVVFAGSVQPNPRPHTDGVFAVLNVTLYAFVVVFCATVGSLTERSEELR
jgi:Na+/proline symporter